MPIDISVERDNEIETVTTCLANSSGHNARVLSAIRQTDTAFMWMRREILNHT